jgi:hypothetical protein
MGEHAPQTILVRTWPLAFTREPDMNANVIQGFLAKTVKRTRDHARLTKTFAKTKANVSMVDWTSTVNVDQDSKGKTAKLMYKDAQRKIPVRTQEDAKTVGKIMYATVLRDSKGGIVSKTKEHVQSVNHV